MRTPPRLGWWGVLLLILHILPFASRAALIGGDEPHYALMAHSIVVDRDLDLGEDYARVEAGSQAAGRKAAGKSLDRHVRPIGDRDVPIHPVGLPFLAAPLIALKEALTPGAAPDVWLALLTLSVTFAALVTGWRLLSQLLGDARDAALLVVCVYFASPVWFYSRTFFTEPYQWAFAMFAIAAITSRRLLVASVFLALVMAMKETGALLVTAIVFGTMRQLGSRALLPLLVGPGVYGLLFLLKNQLLVGTPWSTFQPYRLGDPLEGAVGLLAGGSAGLLWFAPVLVLAVCGFFVRSGVPRVLLTSAALAFAAYFAITAGWTDWRGGSGYAGRLLVPVLPALVLPLAALYRSGWPARRVIFPLFLAGFAVNLLAAIDPFRAFWNASALELVRANLAAALLGLVVGSVVYVLTARLIPRE